MFSKKNWHVIVKSHNLSTGNPITWRDQVLNSPQTAAVVAHVQNSRDDIADGFRNANLREVPQLADLLTNSTPEVRQRSEAHFKDHANAFVSAVEHDFEISYPDYGFIVNHAAHRARLGYPLAEILHGYRIGQRICWEFLCQSLTVDSGAMPETSWRLMMALSVFTFEYTNHISAVLADAYYEESRLLERSASSARSEFVDRLIRNPDDPSLSESASRFNFNPKSHFSVVIVRVPDVPTSNYDVISEAQRQLDQLLQHGYEHRLIEIRRSDIICILATSRISDRNLEKIFRSTKLEWIPAINCRIGISGSREGLSSVSSSYEDALIALGQTSIEHPVVRFNAISLFDHLVKNASLSAYRIKPPWVESLIAEDKRTKGVLLRTLNAYVNCRMSAKKAAENLNVHTNTVYQRINKIEEICNLSDFSSPDLIDVLVAANLHLE